nr:sensor histidine kinase [Bacillus sp. SM2101]
MIKVMRMIPSKLLFWYINLPIRHKLLVWFVPLILTTVAITGFISYQIAAKQVFSKIDQNQDNLLKKSIDQFDLIAQDVNDFTNYLFLSSSVQDYLSSNSPNTNLRQQMNESLSKILVTRPNIHSLIVYDINSLNPFEQPLTINQGKISAESYEFFRHTIIYDKAKKQDGDSIWYLANSENSLFIGDNQFKLLNVRMIKNIYDLNPEGFVVTGINEKFLRKKYMSLEDPETEMLVMNNDGQILTATNQDWVGSYYFDIPPFQTSKHVIEEMPRKYTTDDWIISHDQSPLTEWRVVIIQSKKTVLLELNQIRLITVIAIILCFIGGSIVSWFAAFRLTSPLKKLIRSMRKLENGDFSQSVKFVGNDEIGQLGQGYDNMVHRIKKLIDDVYFSKIQQREAELKTLQAQINPHFLYNTLNTICWTAQRKGEPEIANMAYALSSVFRLSLNNGKDSITIRQEIELVKNYLYIQEQRFKPKLTYEIDIVPEVLDIEIPKLLIQPFIENAILHGIEPNNESGYIKVQISHHHDTCLIEVTDNGVGMNEKTVLELNRSLKSYQFNSTNEKQDRSYAILNIKERLKLLYDEQATLTFHSVKGRGTRVELRLPLEK